MSLATANVSYVRQNNILDPTAASNLHVTIAGCGTVGSNAAMQLARAGFKRFMLIDMDTIEAHNLPSQAFTINQLGAAKTNALAEGLQSVSEKLVVTTGGELYGGEVFPAGALIAAVDSMEMRKKLFNGATLDPSIELFVDFRMSGNTLQCWAFNPQDPVRANQYAATLYSSAEAVPSVCGSKTFAPIGALSGAVATQIMTKHVRPDDHPPFYLMMDWDRFQCEPIGLPKLED